MYLGEGNLNFCTAIPKRRLEEVDDGGAGSSIEMPPGLILSVEGGQMKDRRGWGVCV